MNAKYRYSVFVLDPAAVLLFFHLPKCYFEIDVNILRTPYFVILNDKINSRYWDITHFIQAYFICNEGFPSGTEVIVKNSGIQIT